MEDPKDLEKTHVLHVPETPSKPRQTLKCYVRRKSLNLELIELNTNQGAQSFKCNFRKGMLFVSPSSTRSLKRNHFLNKPQDISSSSDSNLEEKCSFSGDYGFMTMKGIDVESETHQGVKSSESKFGEAKEDSENVQRKKNMMNSKENFAEPEILEDSQFINEKKRETKTTKITPKRQRFHRPRILEEGKKPRDLATTRLRTISRKRKKKDEYCEEEIITAPRTPEKQSLPNRRKSKKTQKDVVRPLVFNEETIVSCVELSKVFRPSFTTARRKMAKVRRTDFHCLIAVSFPMPKWKKKSRRSNRMKNVVRWTNSDLLEEILPLVTSRQKVEDFSSQANGSLQIAVVPVVQQMKPSLPDIHLQIKGNKRELLLKGKQKTTSLKKNNIKSFDVHSNERKAHQTETTTSCAVPKRHDKKAFEYLIQQMRYQKDHGLSSLADVPLHIEETLMRSTTSCPSPKQRIRKTKDIAKLIKGMRKLNINKRVTNAIIKRKKDMQLVVVPKVNLDSESIKKWELLMMNDIPKVKEAESYLKGEKELQAGVYLFIDRMYLVQGDRKFQEWKGSVVDSVVGVFLTQNVSDILSSNAFMSVAAKFPVKDQEYYIEEPPEINDSNSVVNNHEATYVGNDDVKSFECVSLPEASIQEAGQHEKTAKRKNKKTGVMEDEKVDWKSLRNMYTKEGSRDKMHMDCVDWNVVRLSSQKVFENTIIKRGQFRILSGRILKFLNNEAKENGTVDLEWLRNAPSDLVKRYLLEIDGIGLKSAECVRLLGLKHSAFPVDTNVGRIVVRLGWVPLEPLPNGVQLHQLDQYPSMDLIQKYLWPRLYKLPQETLYELHYQMITFGKVFCTKVLPNCNACPMKAECKYFASAYISSKVLLEDSKEKTQTSENTKESKNAHEAPNMTLVEECVSSESNDQTNCCESRVEYPSSPNVEMPELIDIEDFPYTSPRHPYVEIPKIRMDIEAFQRNVDDELIRRGRMPENSDDDVSKALVPAPENACIPMQLPPHLKNIDRLRTAHVVYVLPDGHELLAGFERREVDDPIPYLVTIWQPGETSYTFKTPKKKCDSDGSKLCEIKTCSYCSTIREKSSDIFRGTILIPCRTAMRGGFPLNGTYFQTNEVFADYDTSLNPIVFPREKCEGLEKRALFCGSSVSAISKFLHFDQIQFCFWTGFVCMRAFDRKTRNPEILVRRLHTPPDERGLKHMKEFDE